VIPADDLMAEAMSLAHRLTKVPRAALRDTKLGLNSYIEAQLERGFEIAFSAEEASMASPEHAAAVAAARHRS
jgi:enoyl-CoA hydratase/carnithine racemase